MTDRPSPIRTFYQQRLTQIMAARQIMDLSKSAVVFAPHPDDETLGCGGTILRKKAAGAEVKIVFMTDGSRSHAALIDAATLAAQRRQEALNAAEVLGIAATAVTFFGVEDGRLMQSTAEATERVRALLQAEAPAEVFVPYRLEPPPDHVATYQIVMRARSQLSAPPIVYAYPIWYWRHWPWTTPSGNGRRETLEILKMTINSGFGTAIYRDFQHAVDIGPVKAQKRQALEQHVSQMHRPPDRPNWPILADVSHGNFLNCFFQDYELFHRPD